MREYFAFEIYYSIKTGCKSTYEIIEIFAKHSEFSSQYFFKTLLMNVIFIHE